MHEERTDTEENHEELALGQAIGVVAWMDVAGDLDVRDRSLEAIPEEARLFREALTLLFAIPALFSGGPVVDPREQAVMTIAALQRELLWAGWKNLLEGRHAAAMNHVRTLDELADYVQAAAISEEGAKLLLSEGEWRFGDVPKVLASDDATSHWASVRKAHARRDLHRFAHTTETLLMSATTMLPDRIDVRMGPHLDEAALKRTAGLYLDLAALAVYSVKQAFGDRIAEGGRWEEQAYQLLERFLPGVLTESKPDEGAP